MSKSLPKSKIKVKKHCERHELPCTYNCVHKDLHLHPTQDTFKNYLVQTLTKVHVDSSFNFANEKALTNQNESIASCPYFTPYFFLCLFKFILAYKIISFFPLKALNLNLLQKLKTLLRWRKLALLFDPHPVKRKIS